MSKYTAESVRGLKMLEQPLLSEALEAFAVMLEREEEEHRRDPVADPKFGDRMIMPCGWQWVYIPHKGKHAPCGENGWVEEIERFPGATIIRRRETPK